MIPFRATVNYLTVRKYIRLKIDTINKIFSFSLSTIQLLFETHTTHLNAVGYPFQKVLEQEYKLYALGMLL